MQYPVGTAIIASVNNAVWLLPVLAPAVVQPALASHTGSDACTSACTQITGAPNPQNFSEFGSPDGKAGMRGTLPTIADTLTALTFSRHCKAASVHMDSWNKIVCSDLLRLGVAYPWFRTVSDRAAWRQLIAPVCT